MFVSISGHIQTNITNTEIKEHTTVKSATKVCLYQAQNTIQDLGGLHFMMLLKSQKSCSSKMPVGVSTYLVIYIFALNGAALKMRPLIKNARF